MFLQYAPVSKIAVFLINVTGISLVLTIILANVKPLLKKLFVLMTILMFMWVDFAFLARLLGEGNTSLLSIKLAWSITPLLFVLVYSFINNFLEDIPRNRYLRIGLYLLGLSFIFIVNFSKHVISDIMFKDGVLVILYGKLVWFFFGTIALLSFINFFILISAYKVKKNNSDTKSRIKYLLVGLTIFFLANAIFNIIFPVFFSRFDLYELGDYSTIIFLSLIAYAIVRYNFFGVKVVATSFLVTFLGSFLLLDALIFSPTTIQKITKIFIFLFYIPFGLLLIKSVLREVKQREELQELTDKLKAMDEQKDTFISMAAHELRAPMTAIKGYVSMILEGDAGDITDKARGYLADTNAINDRLVRLVNNMLNVSRIEEGRMVYQVEIVNLAEVVRTVFSQFRPEAERKGLELSSDVPMEIKDRVEVDPDRIQEVIGNFLSNAVKYTNEGSVMVKLRQPSENIVRLEVVDTGPGISKEEQAKLFNKFYRAESTVGKTIGTGLGLYISRLLIEKFGGKIGIDSEVGKGSIFWFELPVKPVTVPTLKK